MAELALAIAGEFAFVGVETVISPVVSKLTSVALKPHEGAYYEAELRRVVLSTIDQV